MAAGSSQLRLAVQILAGVSALIQLITIQPLLQSITPPNYQSYIRNPLVIFCMAWGTSYASAGNVLAALVALVIGFVILKLFESSSIHPDAAVLRESKGRPLAEVASALGGEYYVQGPNQVFRVLVDEHGDVVDVIDERPGRLLR